MINKDKIKNLEEFGPIINIGSTTNKIILLGIGVSSILATIYISPYCIFFAMFIPLLLTALFKYISHTSRSNYINRHISKLDEKDLIFLIKLEEINHESRCVIHEYLNNNHRGWSR